MSKDTDPVVPATPSISSLQVDDKENAVLQMNTTDEGDVLSVKEREIGTPLLMSPPSTIRKLNQPTAVAPMQSQALVDNMFPLVDAIANMSINVGSANKSFVPILLCPTNSTATMFPYSNPNQHVGYAASSSSYYPHSDTFQYQHPHPQGCTCYDCMWYYDQSVTGSAANNTGYYGNNYDDYHPWGGYPNHQQQQQVPPTHAWQLHPYAKPLEYYEWKVPNHVWRRSDSTTRAHARQVENHLICLCNSDATHASRVLTKILDRNPAICDLVVESVRSNRLDALIVNGVKDALQHYSSSSSLDKKPYEMIGAAACFEVEMPMRTGPIAERLGVDKEHIRTFKDRVKVIKQQQAREDEHQVGGENETQATVERET